MSVKQRRPGVSVYHDQSHEVKTFTHNYKLQGRYGHSASALGKLLRSAVRRLSQAEVHILAQ